MLDQIYYDTYMLGAGLIALMLLIICFLVYKIIIEGIAEYQYKNGAMQAIKEAERIKQLNKKSES